MTGTRCLASGEAGHLGPARKASSHQWLPPLVSLDAPLGPGCERPGLLPGPPCLDLCGAATFWCLAPRVWAA